MAICIGIRREDKNRWERRVPLIPRDVASLQDRHGLRFVVQPSKIRVYPDAEYRERHIAVDEDLSPAGLIFAVKEVPVHLIEPGKVYVFFAHVAKGQPQNMPMLRRLIESRCTVVDYEKVADEQKRRLIFFGRHAGYAGMIETLRALGRRLAAGGVSTPLAEIRHAFEYHDLEAAKAHLAATAEAMRAAGLPRGIPRCIIGFSGYGNVSAGAQDVLEWMQPAQIPVSGLSAAAAAPPGGPWLVKTVFREEDMVRPRDAGHRFELQDYYRSPERYVGCFETHLPHLDVLVNAIYWEPRYPRLVTREWAEVAYGGETVPRLKVIGDISCDIEGSIELTVRITEPDNPCFVYLPETGRIVEGVEGKGPVIMAVDNLPCELPRESSQYFSSVLIEMVLPLASANWEAEFPSLNLPPFLKRAVIVHRGELTPSYQYLHKHLEASGLH